MKKEILITPVSRDEDRIIQETLETKGFIKDNNVFPTYQVTESQLKKINVKLSCKSGFMG